MIDCFVSYKREDETRVVRLVEGLRDTGLTVWWDRDIAGGERWRETIAQQLDTARCVIVCWTETSAAPEGTYVREEAERAKARGVLLPVLMDRVAIPFGFGEMQALDLVAWTGNTRDPRWQHFVATAEAIVRGEPRPAQRVRKIRRWGAVAALAAVVAAVVGFINDVSGLQSTLCRASTPRAACRALGLGNVPSVAEEETWQRAQGSVDGEGFRAYLREYPDGAFAQAAQARLTACRKQKMEQWSPRVQTLPLIVPGAFKAASNEAGARALVAPRVAAEAQRTCQPFANSDVHRLRESRASEAGWRCDEGPQGWRCSFDGDAICALEERSTSEREICG